MPKSGGCKINLAQLGISGYLKKWYFLTIAFNLITTKQLSVKILNLAIEINQLY